MVFKPMSSPRLSFEVAGSYKAVNRKHQFLLGAGIFFFLLILSASSDGATLTSVTITPSNPTVLVGQTQAFAASGGFSDGTNRSLTPAVPLAVGERHACVVLVDGSVTCWGANGNGQLGNGGLANSNMPGTVTGISTATGVGLGTGVYHNCARLANGQVRCWGHNGNGQLGNGSFTNATTPVGVSGVSNANVVATGAYHTCAVLSDGAARCWGGNSTGQLGNGDTVDSSTPVVVTGVSAGRTITAGYYHTCALLTNGSVRCWGYNGNGQLGDGTFANSSTPVTPLGLPPAVGISAGAFHTCALLADGSMRCWGFNAYGQLGNGTFTGSGFPTPVVPTGSSPAVAVGAGAFHTCAVMANGSAQCWGYNGTGQLGNGTLTNSAQPAVVSGLSNAAAIAGGYFHSCAVLADGSVRCWGNNGVGQLGTGNFTNSTTPVAVSGLSSAFVLEWSTGDSNIARIDRNGVATALSAGPTTVTARVHSVTGNGALTAVPPSSQLVNLSTRAHAEQGDNVVIGGFWIGGGQPKTVLIRARGPSLGGAPFNNSGVLVNPFMRLYSGSTLIAQNDDWRTLDPLCVSPASACGGETQIIASGLDPCQPNPGQPVAPPGCNQEAALLVTLQPGGYTTFLYGVGGASGMGLVEVFELGSSISKLINISTRARVQTGDNVMIGGFYISGSAPKTVLIRARGGSLGGAPFNNPAVLANPTIQLYSGATVIARNNDWQTTDPLCLSPATACGNATQIAATGLDPCQPNPGQTVAPPGCAAESAIHVTLPPGGYTAIVSGVGGTSGLGLVEVFEVSP